MQRFSYFLIVSLIALGFLVPVASFAVGAFPVATGGTGSTTLSNGQPLLGAGTSAVTSPNVKSNGFVLMLSNGIAVWAATSSAGTGTVTNVATTWPVLGGPITNTGTISWGGLATSSNLTGGQLVAVNDASHIYSIATSSIFSGTNGQVLAFLNGAWAGTATTTFTNTAPITTTFSAGSNQWTIACATCNTSAATVTSITAGTGLNGGTITTAGTLALTSYVATSTADTSSQVLFFTSTNSTPATFGGNAAFTFATGANKLTITNASTTNFTAATSLQIPTSASQAPTVSGYVAQDTTNGQFVVGDAGATDVFDKRRNLTLSYATTTAWTGTTTLPSFVIPTGMTWNTMTCTVLPTGGTLNAQYQYANPTAYTTVFATMVPASTTPGVYTFTTNNTPANQATSTIAFGTPGSSPTSISCTLTGPVTGT